MDFFIRRSLLFSLAMFVAVPSANAGVTIHYEGTARNALSVERILEIVTQQSLRNGWSLKSTTGAKRTIRRFIDDKEVVYRGGIKGVVIETDPMCESLHIEFGDDLFLQDYVKTQFAPIHIHQNIVALLKAVEPLMSNFQVFDEGKYWATGNLSILQSEVDKTNATISKLKTKRSLRGPVRIPNGRIIDLVE